MNLYAYCWNNPVYYVDLTGNYRNCVKDAYDQIRANNPDMPAAEAHRLAMQQASVLPLNLNFDDIRAYRGIDVASIPLAYRADPRYIVNMNFGTRSTNSAGWQRSSRTFFRTMLRNNPNIWRFIDSSSYRRWWTSYANTTTTP